MDDLKRIDALKARLERCPPLPGIQLEKLREDWLVTQTYHSNAIEGNTLTLQETMVVLLHGITVDGKPLKDHLEAVGHRDAMLKMMAFAAEKKPLSEEDILEMHRLVLKGSLESEAGFYRKQPIRVTGSQLITANYAKVPDLMAQMVAGLNVSQAHPVLKAADAHFELVVIHPFLDGNGRTARLLMNLMLMREGYPPALLPVERRREYYQALEAGHTTDDRSQFYELVGKIVVEGLERVLYIAEPGPEMGL